MAIFIRRTLSKTLENVRYLRSIYTDNEVENIYTKEDDPSEISAFPVKNQYISILGYGPQGRGQALNLRDNGFNVNIGVRKGPSWANAIDDEWEPGVNLFDIDEACNRSQIICNLLSDAGQIKQWDTIKSNLKTGNTLYFSHGFGITYSDQTGMIPPDDVDVIMVSPKGSGLTLRNKFVKGLGTNSSFAVYQDYTGNAQNTALSMAFGIGSDQVFKTTFEKEVRSDLVGERCVLMGLIQGAFLAQYKLLRNKGHSPCEAYNETVEEALESLYPLINEKGMDYLYKNCSTTAQRGALDWAPIFENKLYPIMEYCYQQVESGEEARKVIRANNQKDYRETLDKELNEMSNSELWTIGRQLRYLKKDPHKKEPQKKKYKYTEFQNGIKKEKTIWEGPLL